MKVPANLSGDRLILDYLTRVTVAGTRYLPKGSRIAFVGNTRNRIEREIGPGGTADPAHVREVLARLGEPEDLVKAERARLDAERVSRQSRAAGAAGAEEAPVTTGPLEARPINSRWRPATRTRPTPRPPSDGQGAALRDRFARRRGAAGDGKRKGWLGGLLKDRPGTQPEAQPGEQAPPAAAAHPPAGPAGQAPGSTARPAAGGAAGRAPGGPAPGRTAGAAPGGTAAGGRSPGGPAGQAAGGPARWPSAGAGGQAPGVGSPPPDARGTQAPPGAGTGAPPGAGTRASRWAAAAAGTQDPAGTGTGTRAGDAGTQAPGGTGTRAGGGGTQAPGGTGTRAGGGGTQAPGGTGTRAGGAGAQAGGAGRRAGGGQSPRRGSAGWLTPTAVIPPAAGSRPAGRAGPSGGDTPVHGIPVLRPGPDEPREPLTVRAAAAALGRGAARLAVSAARLARRYPLETAAVTLLALGGLILPFPYWLFGGLLGGVLSIWSSMWLARDKWIAIFGPLIVVIAGTILGAVITGGHGGAVRAYPHAFVLYAGDLLRFGNVLCAAYLVAQARRAPQRRLPPWQRQRQPPPWQQR
jgi:hypothetical protein